MKPPKKQYAQPTYVEARTVSYRPPQRMFLIGFTDRTLARRLGEDGEIYDSAIYYPGCPYAFSPLDMHHWKLGDHHQAFVDGLMGAGILEQEIAMKRQ